MGCMVHSPAQVLPRSNWATVADHLARWSVCTCAEPGFAVCPERGGALVACMRQVRWPILVFLKDKRIINDCITRHKQALIRDAGVHLGSVRDTTLLSLSCMAHGLVLCLKPGYSHITGLAAFLVKLGHAFENGRTMLRFLDQLRHYVFAHFRYRRVRVLPPGHPAWQQQARKAPIVGSALVQFQLVRRLGSAGKGGRPTFPGGPSGRPGCPAGQAGRPRVPAQPGREPGLDGFAGQVSGLADGPPWNEAALLVQAGRRGPACPAGLPTG